MSQIDSMAEVLDELLANSKALLRASRQTLEGDEWKRLDRERDELLEELQSIDQALSQSLHRDWRSMSVQPFFMFREKLKEICKYYDCFCSNLTIRNGLISLRLQEVRRSAQALTTLKLYAQAGLKGDRERVNTTC